MAKVPSMASLLPLLVFHHQPQPLHHDGDDDDKDDEMLMLSLSKQSMHERMDQDHLAGGNNMTWTTPQGWMLLIQCVDPPSSSPALLWNPLTRDRLPLPDVGDEHDIPEQCKCLLSHKDPTHPCCVVVLFPYATPDIWYCRVAAADDDHHHRRWKRHSYDIGNYALPVAYRPPTKQIIPGVAAVRGKLYFIKPPKQMCTIDFSATKRGPPLFRNLNVRLVDFPPRISAGRDWLVESQDRLFLVEICFVGFDANNIADIRVYRLNFTATAWRRVDDIGDVVFLLEDANMAASCPASTLGLKSNQIYFMKNLKDDDADLCIFDLKSGRQEITRVHQQQDLLLYRKPFWIVPPI